MKNLFLGVAILPLLICRAAPADDWPQYRGPNHDGVWNETGILEKFPADGLKYRWRVPIGSGFSTPVVAKGRVYVTDAVFSKPLAVEHVLCFDEVTGKSLWSFAYDVTYPDWAYVDTSSSGPTPTPIVDEGKIYTIGNRGDLLCLDAATGNLVWRINLETQFKVQEFSFSASPVIEGDLLILSLGSNPQPEISCLIAVEKNTGKFVWKTPDDGVTPSTPIVVSAGGKTQLIYWAKQSIISLDPATGTLYWKLPNKVGSAYACAHPVLQGDRLLVGGVMLKLQAEQPGATVIWPQTKGTRGKVLSNTSTPIFRGDHIYSAKTNGQLVCLEASTGNELWENTHVTDQQSGSSIHITPNGNRAFLFTDQGDLILAQLAPEGYTEISRTRLIEGTFPFGGKKRAWIPPAFANHHVFARSDKELVCASLAARP